MDQKEIKQALIKSAIHTISNVGIDNATTKQLATNAGVNEVYIYRIFGGKDALFKAAFNYVDIEFSNAILKILPLTYTYEKNIDPEKHFNKTFKLIWQHTLKDKEQCAFFIRYYYSRCYTADMSEERKKIYAPIIKLFSIGFLPNTDTWWLFNHILDVIFSSAVKVLRSEIPDNQETEDRIFNLLFFALKPYLK